MQVWRTTTESEKEIRPAQPRSPVMTGWIIAPIRLIVTSAEAEMPDVWTATTRATLATPVPKVSSEKGWEIPLSRILKLASVRPSIGRPCVFWTVVGTKTRRV